MVARHTGVSGHHTSDLDFAWEIGQDVRRTIDRERCDMTKRHYTKPALRKLGLLRSLTRFSF
jgi:hypothetical protein